MAIPKTSRQSIILIASCIIFIAFYAFIKIQQFHYLIVGAYDYTLYNQSLWNTLHGHFLATSLYGSPSQPIIAIHTTFFHALFAPFYGLFPYPETLSIIQSVLFAASAFPIYAVAAKRLGRTAALFLSIAYLLNPVVMNCQTIGYYGTRVCPVPILLFALWALSEEHLALHIVLLISAALCDEATAIIVGALGIYEALFTKNKKLGIWIAIASSLYFICAVNLIMPSAWAGNNNPLGPLNLRTQHTTGLFWLTKYIVTHPHKLIRNILQERKFKYLFKLFLPFIFSPLFTPSWLLPAIPTFFLVLMLTPRWLLADYTPAWTVLTLPFLFFGAIATFDHWSQWAQRFAKRDISALLCFIVVLTTLATYEFADRPELEYITSPTSPAASPASTSTSCSPKTTST